MLKVSTSVKFRKDIKICAKRGYDLQLLESVVNTLRIPASLPSRYKDHMLTGDRKGNQECHILPDWLLIYRVLGDELYLVRTGTHADLFKK